MVESWAIGESAVRKSSRVEWNLALLACSLNFNGSIKDRCYFSSWSISNWNISNWSSFNWSISHWSSFNNWSFSDRNISDRHISDGRFFFGNGSDLWGGSCCGFCFFFESEMLSFGCCYFGSVLYGFGSFTVENGSLTFENGSFAFVNWGDGQIVGQDAESSVISGVRDHDLFSFRVDVSVRADLVTESIAVMGSSLSGVGETI
jgi:hypothetical protein